MFEHGVILAAGRGMRMRPFSNETPKPLLPSLDHCLIGHQIGFIRPFVRNLHVTVSHLAEQIIEFCAGQKVDNIINTYGGGNASWIELAKFSEIETSTLVITCDNLMKLDLTALYEESQLNSKMSLIVPILDEKNKPGDRITVSEKIITSLSPRNNSSFLASGLQVVNTFEASKCSQSTQDFSQIWRGLISHQKLSVSEFFPTNWFALDTPEDLERWKQATENPKVDI